MKFFIVLFVLSFVAGAAKAGDVEDLSENFPLTIEDANPTENRAWQIQLPVTYEKEADDDYKISPSVQYGVTNDLQLEVASEMIQGTSQRNNSGDIQASALYQLPIQFPEMALKFTGIAPTGIDSRGFDHKIGFLSTVDLCPGLKSHLDLSWNHNNSPNADERRDGFLSGLALQHLYNDKTSSMISFVREVKLQKAQESNLIEIGMLQSLGKDLTGGASVGAGIGDDSPDFTARLALQQSL